MSESISLSNVGDELPLGVDGWTVDSARSVLRLKFGERDCERIIQLESKAAQTRLTDGEQAELGGYEQVAVFLEFLKRSARGFLSCPGTGDRAIKPSSGDRNLPER